VARGCGLPWDQEIEDVKWDVLNEYVSVQAVRNVYGVVVDPETLEVKRDETERLRTKHRQGREA
jgi:N-methylhydantoinase B/oxoprolinase/acetone carboxylase alpha subunit